MKIRIFDPLDGSFTERQVKLHITFRARMALIFYLVGISCFSILGAMSYRADQPWLMATFTLYVIGLLGAAFSLCLTIRKYSMMNTQLSVMQEFIDSPGS